MRHWISHSSLCEIILSALLSRISSRHFHTSHSVTRFYVYHHFLPRPKQSPQKLHRLTVTDTVPNNTCKTTLASVQTCPDNQERVCSVIIADTPTAFSRQRWNWALIVSITRDRTERVLVEVIDMYGRDWKCF